MGKRSRPVESIDSSTTYYPDLTNGDAAELITTVSRECAEVLQALERSREQLRSARLRVDELERSAATANDTVEAMALLHARELAGLEPKHASSEEQRENLASELRQVRASLACEVATREEVERSRALTAAAHEKLAAAYAALETREAELRAEVSDLRANAPALEEPDAEVKTLSDEAISRTTDLEAIAVTDRHELVQLREELASAQEALEQKSRENAVAEEQRLQLHSKLQEANTSLTRQVCELEKRWQASDHELLAARAERGALNERFAVAKRRIESLKKDAETGSVQRNEAVAEAWRRAQEDLAAVVASHQAELQRRNEQADKSRARQERQAKQVLELQTQREHHESELDELRAGLARSHRDEIERERAVAQDEIAAARRAQAVAEAAARAADVELVGLRETVARFESAASPSASTASGAPIGREEAPAARLPDDAFTAGDSAIADVHAIMATARDRNAALVVLRLGSTYSIDELRRELPTGWHLHHDLDRRDLALIYFASSAQPVGWKNTRWCHITDLVAVENGGLLDDGAATALELALELTGVAHSAPTPHIRAWIKWRGVSPAQPEAVAAYLRKESEDARRNVAQMLTIVLHDRPRLLQKCTTRLRARRARSLSATAIATAPAPVIPAQPVPLRIDTAALAAARSETQAAQSVLVALGMPEEIASTDTATDGLDATRSPMSSPRSPRPA